jgi:hypothetical protein
MDDKENFNDLTGCVFSHLKVLRRCPNHYLCGCKMWRCACDCGGHIDAYETALLEARTTGCGCGNQIKARRMDWQAA